MAAPVLALYAAFFRAGELLVIPRRAIHEATPGRHMPGAFPGHADLARVGGGLSAASVAGVVESFWMVLFVVFPRLGACRTIRVVA